MSQHFVDHYFPNLDIESTQKLLGDLKEKEKFPLFYTNDRGETISSDEVFLGWVGYCGDVLKQIILVTEQPGKIDIVASSSYMLFIKALGSGSGEKENIQSIQSGFAMLLSEQARATLPDEVVPAKKTNDIKLKNIMTLVDSMANLQKNHVFQSADKWDEVYKQGRYSR